MTPIRFTLFFLLYAALVGLLAVTVSTILGIHQLMPGFWVMFGALAFLSWAAFIFSWIGIKKGGEFSVYSILGALVVKLLLGMLLALVYLQKINVNKVTFVIDFISIYFFFSAFEMWCLLTNLRHQNKSE